MVRAHGLETNETTAVGATIIYDTYCYCCTFGVRLVLLTTIYDIKKECKLHFLGRINACGLRGVCNKGTPVLRVLFCATLLEKSQKFRVRVWGSYRTYRNFAYGTEVLQNSQKFRVLWHGRTEITNIMKIIYLYSRYLGHWRTELPQVLGTGIKNVIQNFQKLRVRV